MRQPSSSSRPAPDSAPFFQGMPRHALARFLAAVSLVFAPLMLLTNSTLAARSWGTMLFWCAVSGMIAALWAGAFIVSKKLLIPAIVLNLAAVASIATRWPAFLQTEAPRPSLFGVLAALTIAGGYVFFVLFVAGEGARTLRLHTELRLARQIHRSLVPTISLSAGSIEVYGRSDPSSEMGGDLIDLVARGNCIDVYLADVSGHGVRAGVLMAMVKSALRTKLLASANGCGDGGGIAAVIGDLNRVVAQVKEQDMFVTLASARFQPNGDDECRGCDVRCALAGHLPLLHWRASDRTLNAIDNQSLPLGVVDDERFEASALAMKTGDLLVFYTDGLIECTDESGQEFGMARFKELIVTAAHRPLPELFESVFAAVRRHGPQVDDQTLLLVRLRPAAAGIESI